MISCLRMRRWSAPISLSRRHWSSRSTHGIGTPLAIRPRLRCTREISRRDLSLPEEQQQVAFVAGLVHDIGKIGLSASLLEKPGALSLEERRDMQRHSEIGERILSNVATYSEIASIVRHHHERVDGGGYPDGLVGEQIPYIARIIGVADAYNAMTSDRPYRDAMPSRVARLRLAQAAETQFDTAVLAAFEAILAGATERYRVADFDGGNRVEFEAERVRGGHPVGGESLICGALDASLLDGSVSAFPRADCQSITRDAASVRVRAPSLAMRW